MFLHALQSEWDADVRAGNPLDFPGYEPPGDESVRTGRTASYALIEGRFDVMGGSMGAAHGERVVRAYRRAADERLPVVVVASSGGARMQEGMIALAQLPRTAAAARTHAAAGLLQLAILRGPTTGGVYASYASLADLKVAEPGATIGFAGPRVVELTTGKPVGSDSHTAESAARDGLVDGLVARADQAAWVEAALGLAPGRDAAWIPPGARARAFFDSWVGMSATPPDPCISAALATIGGRRVVAVTMNGARPQPSGYRLTQRAVALAGRVGLPLVTIVDTPGADPSPTSEADGLASAIASTFAAMDGLPTVSVAVCVGTGGSGGALALAHADRLLMTTGSTFSVIAPEGAAAILDRTTDTAAARARQLRITADDQVALGIADAVVAPEHVRDAILRALDEATPGDRLRRLDAATERWLR